MKRSVDDSTNTTESIKRTKSNHGEVTFDLSKQRSATDVYEHGIPDSEDSFLTFRVSMKWDHIPGKYHLQAQEPAGQLSYTYDVFFLHQCARFFHSLGVQFDFGDTIRVSLRGAKVAKKPRESSGSRGLPMSITYEEGVCLEFVKKKTPLASGSVINFWPAARQNAPSGDAPLTDDWFSTPPENLVAQNPPTTEPASIERTNAAPSAGSPLRNETSMDVDAPVASSSSLAQPQPHPPPAVVAKKLYRDTNSSKRHQKSTSTSTDTSRKASPTTSNVKSKVDPPSNSKSNSNSKSPNAAAGPSNNNDTAANSKKDGTAANSKHDNSTSGASKAARKAQRKARKAAYANGGAAGGAAEVEVDTDGHERAVDVVARDVLPPAPPGPVSTVQPVPAPALLESSTSKPAPARSVPIPATRSLPQVAPSETKTSKSPHSTSFTTTKSLVTSVSIPPSSSSQPKPPPSSSQTLTTNLKDVHGPWTPLDALQPGRVSLAIGVVCAIGGVNTSARDEKYRRITLLDHTNHDPSAPIGSSGFTLICFDKRTAENLPDAVVGDVLVVRDMWTENHRGARLTGSCPSYKSWSWTIFHPEDGTLHSGGPALSPHSPHTHPVLSSQENQYCVRLADWWREASMTRKEGSGGGEGGGGGEVVVQVVASERGGGREHRLIKDASPYAPPSGYFDCTVEILHGHANTNGVYSLYVTDYTSNPSIAPTHASWCIPALSSLVFKIELWNEAALKGPELNVGEYWEIKNCRIKESTGGYWEGSFSEVRKMRRLDEDELEEVPHLVELLKRKKAWQDEADANGTHKFPHQLIKDAQPDSHFDCTVEILRISPKDDRALLYITDYTPRPDLSFIAATADWTRGIPHDRILKVALLQAQAKAAESLQEGDFVAIRKMRLKAVLGGALSGLLGGEERLLHKLDPVNTGNEDCLALLERRKAWLSAQKAKEAETSKRKSKGKAAAVRQSIVQEVIKIQEPKKRIVPQRLPKTTCVRDLQKVHPDSAPGKYLLLARVVDYWPENLEDFVSLYCSNCQQDIPSHLRICTTCDEDMAESFVRPYFKFSLMLEDDEGERISVALASSREEPNGFLQHIRPVDFREDNKAFEDFKKKLLPLLGSDLIHNRQQLVRTSASGDLDPDSPFHNVVLAKLAHTEGFFFWDYTPASHQSDL